jgi:uncharacterized protein YbbC (DUF1343 family)
MHSKDKRLFVGDFRSEKQKKILFLEDMSRSFVLTFILLFATVLLPAQKVHQVISEVKTSADLQTGADQTEKYIPLLKGRSVALVANQTSMIGKKNLADTLLALKITIKKIFFPEHGFRGNEDNGEVLKSYKDKKTGLTCISLYGKENKKPKAADLKDVDIVVFDLQDVGVRFYTYISTLHYVMEACAENKKKLIILDRPDPNGYYVDGPIMEEKYRSFVGLHPVPIVHGMTIGEYAQMIDGEGWLNNKIKCDLQVIPCQKYSHSDYYELPVKPSPNLPDMASVYLYPSLCLFEGTMVSVGRGTDKPFECFGYPNMPNATYTFTPHPVKGASADPPYNGKECRGYDVSVYGNMYMKYSRQLYLYWIIKTYQSAPDKANFFNPYFLNLTGTDELEQQIKDGKSEEEIHKSWEPGLKKFKEIRKKYLLYKDFE